MLDACTIDVTQENDFAQNQLGSKFSKYSLKLLDSTPNKGGKKNLTQKPTELVENIKNLKTHSTGKINLLFYSFKTKLKSIVIKTFILNTF